MGNNVQVLRRIDQGATCSVFLGINALNMLLAYKLARMSKVAQFEAVQKAIGFIFSVDAADTCLLLASAGLCQDPRYYYVAAALLDDVTEGKFNPGTFHPNTLRYWLTSVQRHEGALGKQDAIKLLGWLASALESLSFLHRNGLVYNDAHPANLGFFAKRPVWIDYTPITFLGDQHHESARWYDAIEGHEATPAHDCYSMVKILIEAITGLHPAGIQPLAISGICQKHLTGLFGEVIRHIACKGLAKDPTQRYQSAPELAEDLQHAKQLLLNDID